MIIGATTHNRQNLSAVGIANQRRESIGPQVSTNVASI
jgi:hypothetical protein